MATFLTLEDMMNDFWKFYEHKANCFSAANSAVECLFSKPSTLVVLVEQTSERYCLPVARQCVLLRQACRPDRLSRRLQSLSRPEPPQHLGLYQNRLHFQKPRTRYPAANQRQCTTWLISLSYFYLWNKHVLSNISFLELLKTLKMIPYLHLVPD